MSTPTPRTSAAIIASGFQAVPEGFRAFAGNLERELTALAAECDQLRAENATLRPQMSTPMPRTCGELSCDECNARTAALMAERDQLRVEVERLQFWIATTIQPEEHAKVIEDLRAALALGQQNCDDAYEDLRAERKDANARADRAEADLATERARLDSGQILLTVAGERVWYSGVDLRAAIDAAMKEGAK